jgi:hypothetical protein
MARGKSKSRLELRQACYDRLNATRPATVRSVAYYLFNVLGLIPSMAKKYGSPGIPVVTGQNSLSRRARPLEILGRPLNDVLFSNIFANYEKLNTG